MTLHERWTQASPSLLALSHADMLHRQTARAKNKQPAPGLIPTAPPILI